MSPPWIKYPNLPRYSMGWRMGEGEDYRDRFDEWWRVQSLSVREACAVAYPEPPAWNGYWRKLPTNSAPEVDKAIPTSGGDSEDVVGSDARTFHNHPHFLKHCEIVAFLVNRTDRGHPSVKHHIRNAIREASNHVAFGPGSAKHSAPYMSLGALAQMQNGNSTGLIAEHVVPVSRLNAVIVAEAERSPMTTESVAAVLGKHTLRAVITAAEDDKLRSLGLHKLLPEGSIAPTSRYAAAGIELVANQYSLLLKHGRK